MSVYSDDWLTIHQGDCREVMAAMEPESVHCVVTSPPYWGLRDYGTATWEGGDEACDHVERMARQDHTRETPGGRGGSFAETPIGFRETCRKCGARRVDAQLGLESTPEEYVANMVAVFREVRRVLRADGTVWLNLGDSYAGSGKGGNPEGSPWKGFVGNAQREEAITKTAGEVRVPAGLKPKDLVGIPWRVAFALQADGWYLRSDIIWSKPNPMPESVTDRPTKAHEYLFLLSKSARYWYDAEAVAEPLADASIERLSQPTIDEQAGSFRVPGKTNGPMRAVGGPSWQERKAAGAHAGGHGGGNLEGSGTQRSVHGAGLSHDLHTKPTRNLRSVWTVATQPYPGAHFATFPEKLVEPCIKAGCPTQVCATCGTAVEYDHAVHLQSVRSGVPGVAIAGGPIQVLQSGMFDAGEAPTGEVVRGVRDTDEERGAVLLAGLREPGDGADEADDQGLRDDAQGLRPPVPTGSPDGDENGLHRGAPTSDGGDARSDAAPVRGRRSHQRDQERQPAGEPPRPDEEGARRPVEPGPGADGPVPRVRRSLRPSWACGECGADLRDPGSLRPGVVLDCFAGSGTTGRVAQRLSRRAVLIDLNADYLLQAMERNRDIPLGLEAS